MNKLSLKKYLAIFFLLELFLSYAPAYAQLNDVNFDYRNAGVSTQIEKYLCAPTPTTSGQTTNSNGSDLYKCINQLYKLAIIVACVVGVFFIVIAGYIYMSAAGNSESTTKAKDILTTTITALVILFAGYVLLKAINPDLIQFQQIQPSSVAPNPNAAATAPTNVAVNSTTCQQSFGNITPATGCTYGSGGGGCRLVNGIASSADSCASNNGSCYLSDQAASHAGQFVTTFKSIASQAGSGCAISIVSTIQVNKQISISPCHKVGNSQTGTCADFSVSPSASTLCLSEFYQAAQQSSSVSSFVDEYTCPIPGDTTGGNIHVNF